MRLVFWLSATCVNFCNSKRPKRFYTELMGRTVIISNSTLNSYGFRVLTEGIQLDQYQRNPILLWMHTRPWRGTKEEVNVIGRVENLRVDGDNLLGDLVFDTNDDFAKSIEQKWDNNFLRMVSAGLEPLDWSTDPKVLVQGQTRATLVTSKLLEVSVADIGANDDALALYAEDGATIKLSAGIDSNIIPEITNTKTGKNMKLIALALGLAEDASEAVILQKITELRAEAAEVVNLRTSAEQQMNSAIAAEVQKAIELKKIKEDKKDHFVELGKKCGLESLQLTFQSMSAAATARPSDILGLAKVGNSAGTGTITKLSEVPVDQLETLRSEDPEEYARLYRAEYGFSPAL